MTESFRVLAIVLAGAKYRLIDFALSNLVNGGFRRIVVLTQYKSHKQPAVLLTEHLRVWIHTKVRAGGVARERHKRWLGCGSVGFSSAPVPIDPRLHTARCPTHRPYRGTRLVLQGHRTPIGQVAVRLHRWRSTNR